MYVDDKSQGGWHNLRTSNIDDANSNGATLRWGGGPHGELGPAFLDIGTDPDTKVVILTGTGSSFIEEVDSSNVGQRLPTTHW